MHFLCPITFKKSLISLPLLTEFHNDSSNKDVPRESLELTPADCKLFVIHDKRPCNMCKNMSVQIHLSVLVFVDDLQEACRDAVVVK